MRWVIAGALLAYFGFFAAYNYLYLVASLSRRRVTTVTPRPGSRVAVVVVSYNEREVIEDTLAACRALHYPHRTVVVGDDSDDPETLEILGRIAKEHHCGEPVFRRYGGSDVQVREGDGFVLFHRERNTGYKGGNLRALGEYLWQAGFDYLYLLDADWRPAPDAIERCLEVIEADPTIAFVQTKRLYDHGRWDLFRHCLAMNEEACYLVDLPGRQRLGHMVLFTGCCALLRLSHLRAVGGFRSGHLTEDLDLSNRFYLAGFRGVYLDSVANVGEVPPNYRALHRQQARWAAGSARACVEYLLPVSRSRALSTRQRFSLLRQNAYYTVALAIDAAFVFAPSTADSWLGALLLLAATSAILPPAIAAMRKRDWPGLLYLPVACWLALSIVQTYAWANLRGFLRADQPWFRTPRRRARAALPRSWPLRLANLATLGLLVAGYLTGPPRPAVTVAFLVLWVPALVIGALAS
jgi:cellulose synthase/poly-beta-1,6-N-acetylglucosamine synthase-like glycosyltransferase